MSLKVSSARSQRTFSHFPISNPPIMTAKIKAHLEAGKIILDEPIPGGFLAEQVYVLLVNSDDNPTAQELAQSTSGFAREVLLNSSENIWAHD